MKIAFLLGEFPCLSQTFILNQITGLIDRGHQVDIYANKPGNEPMVHEDVNAYRLLNRTFYYGNEKWSMPSNKAKRLLKAMGLFLANFHKNPLVMMRSMNIARYKRKALSLNIFYKVIPFIDKDFYDIVHCHFGPLGILGAYLKDVGALGNNVITTFHGYDITAFIQEEGISDYRYLFETGDLFLPISDHWKDKLIRIGCDEKKIMVHRMGIDTNKFTFTPRRPKIPGKLNILTVARLVEKKGVEYGIRAVGHVLKRYPNIEYRIAGDGPLRCRLEGLISELSTSEKVKLLGWKNREEIIQLMKDADVLLAPSVTSQDGDKEGIPVVLMEALAQGMPVISTFHSGIPELIKDGESGFLVPEREQDAIAEKLAYLIEHHEIWLDLGKAGRKNVEDNYDINKLNDQLVMLCAKVLEVKQSN